MNSLIRQTVLALAIGLAGFLTVAPAAMQTTDSSLERSVRHELVTLPFYSIFDNFAFTVDGSKVTLYGQVHRPSLKKSAERVVARLEGVTSVDNQIEILPTSFHDDRIRLAVARTLFSHPVLNRYGLQAVPPIHIIVKNGDVTLEGVVAQKLEKTVASLVTNSIPGIFSVTNNLRVENLETEMKS